MALFEILRKHDMPAYPDAAAPVNARALKRFVRRDVVAMVDQVRHLAKLTAERDAIEKARLEEANRLKRELTESKAAASTWRECHAQREEELLSAHARIGNLERELARAMAVVDGVVGFQERRGACPMPSCGFFYMQEEHAESCPLVTGGFIDREGERTK